MEYTATKKKRNGLVTVTRTKNLGRVEIWPECNAQEVEYQSYLTKTMGHTYLFNAFSVKNVV